MRISGPNNLFSFVDTSCTQCGSPPNLLVITFLFYQQTIKTIMSPPPAATFLALHPRDNNIIAIGSDDSSIQIYDATFNEV